MSSLDAPYNAYMFTKHTQIKKHKTFGLFDFAGEFGGDSEDFIANSMVTTRDSQINNLHLESTCLQGCDGGMRERLHCTQLENAREHN